METVRSRFDTYAALARKAKAEAETRNEQRKVKNEKGEKPEYLDHRAKLLHKDPDDFTLGDFQKCTNIDPTKFTRYHAELTDIERDTVQKLIDIFDGVHAVALTQSLMDVRLTLGYDSYTKVARTVLSKIYYHDHANLIKLASALSPYGYLWSELADPLEAPYDPFDLRGIILRHPRFSIS